MTVPLKYLHGYIHGRVSLIGAVREEVVEVENQAPQATGRVSVGHGNRKRTGAGKRSEIPAGEKPAAT